MGSYSFFCQSKYPTTALENAPMAVNEFSMATFDHLVACLKDEDPGLVVGIGEYLGCRRD